MEYIWRYLLRRRVPKIVLGALVGAWLTICAAAGYVKDAGDLLVWLLAGALMGAVAVGILQYRDWKRSKNPRWNRAVRTLAKELGADAVGSRAEDPLAVAREHLEEAPGGLLFWTGMVLGLFCVLCGIAMTVIRMVEYVRDIVR